MTLPTHEFIRRFLMHVLPKGFHRIRHYGLLASGNRAANIAQARELLAVPAQPKQPDTSEAVALDEPRILPHPCPCCGARMMIIETFARGCRAEAPPHARSVGDQDRHLMMPVIADPTPQRHRHSGRLSPGNTPLAPSANWPAIAPQISSCNVPSARSRRQARPSFVPKRISQPRSEHPHHSRRAKSP